MMQASRQPAIEQMQQSRSTGGTWRTWHTEDDVTIRRTVIQHIYQLFQTKRPVISQEWQQKLPDFVRRLEEVLYRLAKSKDEYSDTTSLETRLQTVARHMVHNPNFSQEARVNGSVNGGLSERHRTPSNQLAQSGAMPHMQTGAPLMESRMGMTNSQSSMMFASSLGMENVPAGPGLDSFAGGAQTPVMIPVNHNGMSAAQPGRPDRSGGNMIPTPSLPSNSAAMMTNGNGRGAGFSTMMGNGAAVVRAPGGNNWDAVPNMIPTASTMPGAMPDGGTGGAPNMIPNPGLGSSGSLSGLSGVSGLVSGHRRNAGMPPDRQQMKTQILKQQRMLLFLRHCAKCNDPACQYRDNCKVGKDLWQHIMACTNSNCSHPRCVHSRELLRHYQQCQQENCPICGPVKEFVKKSQPSGSKGMQVAGQGGQAQQPLHRNASFLRQDGVMVPPNSREQHMPGMMPAGLAAERSRRAGPMDRPPPLPTDQPPLKRPNLGGPPKQSNMGTSLLEVFSPEEIELHLRSTREDMAKQPAPRGQAMPPIPDADKCMVCQAQHIIRFEPPLSYCSSCNTRIKKNQTFYHSADPVAFWCSQCYTNTPGDELKLENMSIKKNCLTKKKNEEQEDEPWVACDMCNKWVHMICGLFNKGRNSDDTHYLCPWCLLDTHRRGVRQPIKSRPQSMLQASELPTCKLSNFLEDHLQRALDEDWIVRAKMKGLHPSEVERAVGLSLRVVNVSSKKVEVKSQFYKAFRDKAPVAAFPYTQKVMLLFQKIEGVDVLLMVIYVQEYGEEAAMPNKRTVYLSYLDSVKYFRPEIETARGGALRTFVYHELLLGYMQHVKNIGMNAMYIWSCPPLAGDDYVLYCHPLRQKNPKADKLREWYHTIIREAKARNIVTRVSTLCDTFLPEGRDHAITECSATHIPYFEGDFWPGEAEAQLTEIENGHFHQPGKKGKKAIGKARGKSSTKTKRMGPVTTDGQLLQRLMDTLGSNQNNMKEDFIVAHFRTPCSTCRNYCDGVKYELNKKREELPPVKVPQFEGIKLETPDQPARPDLPRLFSVCETCFRTEVTFRETGQPSKLPASVTIEDLSPLECERVPQFDDPDHPMDCEIFDTRTSFLQLCQGNHFQFDTLRRAKHSSMMTLYHLHNPNEPAFTGNCNLCQREIQPGDGYRCSHAECQDFDMCKACYAQGLHTQHPHPLMRSGVDERSQRLTKEQRIQRAKTLKRTMMLLEHASACVDDNCRSNSCRRVKHLHRHALECTKKVSGGCNYCKHMWCLLNLHAKQCCNSNCPVPRCSELRELRRRQMAREQDGRRIKYMNWNRQAATASAAQ